MGWSRGTLRQKFTIQLDTEELREYIVNQIVQAIESEKDKKGRNIFDVEVDESYFGDEEELVIEGTYETPYKHWYCRATMYDPEENELEREYIGEDGVGILDKLPDSIRQFVSVKYVTENEDDVEDLCYNDED